MIFAKIKMGLMIAGAVALAILYWSWSARGKEIAALNETVGGQRATILDLTERVANERAAVKILEAQRAEDQEDLLALAADNVELENKLAREVAGLNAWRAKLNGEILRRPAVYERASSLASRRIMREFEALTGGNNGQADEQADVDPTSAPAGDSP